MKGFWFFVAALIPVISFGQGEISVGFGRTYLIQKPTNVDAITRATAMFAYSYTVPVKGKWSLQPHLQGLYTRYIMDGVFSKSNGQYYFGLSPSNYKQSYLDIYSFRMPLYARYVFSSSSKRLKENSISLGPYAEYIFIAKERYKIDEKKYVENAQIPNKLTFGVAFEVTALRGSKSGTQTASLSYGISHQISEYISGRSSFKPLQIYLRLGLGTRKV